MSSTLAIGQRALPLGRGGLGALVLASAASAGCFVEPLGESAGGVLRLAVALPSVAVGPSQFNPWDGQGLFQLHLFPKFVRVAVEFEDYELASGTWPDRERGAVGEDVDGEVTLELKVPAGANRRLRLLAFAAPSGDSVAVYEEREPLSLELAAGQLAEIHLEAVPHATGSVESTVRCNQGNVSDWEPFELSPVDARALVVYPPVALEAGSSEALGARIPAVAVGRPHWTRIILRNRTTKERTFVDVRKPTYMVSAGDETTAVNLTIPCGL